MADFATIVQIASNIAVVTLAVYLIVFLGRLRTILEALERDVREMSARAVPIMDNLEAITDKIRNISENIDDQIEVVKESVNAVREIAENVIEFERRIQARIEEPVLETIGTIAAVLKGVRAFFARLKA